MSAIGYPPLSPQAFVGLALTPRPDATMGVKTNDRSLDALARIPPADDAEAALRPLELHLTADDLAEMRRLSEDLEEAIQLATEAEQRHTAALRTAKGLPHLVDKSGQMAARAIGGDRAAKQAVATLNAQIDDARLAESALKTLADEKAEAARYRDGAYGRLRVHTGKAFARMRERAAVEYAAATDRLRLAVACMSVSIELDGKTMEPLFAAWHTQFVNRLVVPALPEPLRHGTNSAEPQATGMVLLNYAHSYYTGAQSAIRSKLQQQVAGACAPIGLQVQNLL